MAMTDAQIQADMAGLKTQEDLNRYFATSGYSPEQLAAAMPQYGSAADYANAVNLGTQAYNAQQAPVATTGQETPTSTRSPEQLAAIKAAWNQYSQSNPYELTRQMEQYGVSAADIAAATGQLQSTVDNMVERSGREEGFGGAQFYHPAETPTPTNYTDYLKQATTPVTDPTQNWLRGSSTPYTPQQWNDLQARIADEAKRGITFGGGASPNQQAGELTPLPTTTSGTGPFSPPTGPLSTTYPQAVVQPGETVGNSVAPRPPMQWGPLATTTPSFNTPMLNSLYNAQQQRMTTRAPVFNFQATPAEQPGALTQVVQG